MASLTFSRTVLAAIAVAALAGSSACTSQLDSGASKTESRSFDLTGTTLTINTSESELRVETGTGKQVEVTRELTGKAANEGNAAWALESGALNLSVTCSGLVTNCKGSYAVKVPTGVALVINSAGSPVKVVGIAADITASAKADGSLRIEQPAGALNLTSDGGDIVVTKARSANVKTTATNDGNVNVDFASAPSGVEARTNGGSIKVVLPAGAETYRVAITGNTGSGGSEPNDPASKRTITAVARDGNVKVQKATA